MISKFVIALVSVIIGVAGGYMISSSQPATVITKTKVASDVQSFNDGWLSAKADDRWLGCSAKVCR